MYILKLVNQGFTWYLKGTIWTSEQERAFTYDTTEHACSELEKAKPFMKKSLVKKVIIVKL